MKKNIYTFILAILIGTNSILFAQIKPNVMVHPGTELLNVIQLLSDSAQVVNSTYRKDVAEYFRAFKNDPAVQKARKLPFINCDFPVRLSWSFYDFPNLKLSQPDTLLGYERWFDKREVQDYLSSALDFYKRTNFKNFYDKEQAEYKKWIASFNRNLYEGGLLSTLDNFYRFTPNKKIIITLGALNCGTYAIPDIDLINPNFKNTLIIMVAYGNIIGRKASDTTHPNFYAPIWASQLIWHEDGTCLFK